MKYVKDNLALLSILLLVLSIPVIGYTPVTHADETDNDYVVITVKVSPAFVNPDGKVVKESESLEKVCLSMKLAMLLRTDFTQSGPQPKAPDSLPQVTYFPMLDGVRVVHADIANNPMLTCHVQGSEYPLGAFLFMLHSQFNVDVQVCWDCWITRYGYPVAIDDPSNPVLGGWNGTGDLMEFIGMEQMAIQEMFNNSDKVIDFD